MIAEMIQEDVIKELEKLPPWFNLGYLSADIHKQYGRSSFAKDDLITAVRNNDILGKAIIRMYGEYWMSLKNAKK